MKVLFFIKGLYAAGGTEKMTTILANYLDEAGHDVSVLTLESGGELFFALNKGIEVHSLFNRSEVDLLANYFPALFRYHKLLKRLTPDLIIDLGISNSLISLPAGIFRKSRVISWEHFNTYDNWKTYSSKLARWLAAWFSYKVVVLTEKDREHFHDKYHAKNVLCIPNPITLHTSDKADLAAKNVLAIGRLSLQKGFDYLLDAWKLVTEVDDTWKLTIVGAGELHSELLKKRNKLGLDGKVNFEKPTKNISEFYKSSSVFVMSSRFEGLPLVLLEAKSFGLPLVSFNCKTGPEVIVRDNMDGFLVETGNVKVLSEKLLMLMQSKELREEFSSRALDDKARFEPAGFYAHWERVLEEVSGKISFNGLQQKNRPADEEY